MGAEEDRVERVADEAEVRHVIVRLAQYADGLASCEEYAALFTEDAEWLMPGAPRPGRADILAGSLERRAAGGVGPGSNTRHVIASTAMEFPDRDTAVADSYWMFFVETDSAPRLQLMGTYRDTLRRTGGGWLMARREVSFG